VSLLAIRAAAHSDLASVVRLAMALGAQHEGYELRIPSEFLAKRTTLASMWRRAVLGLPIVVGCCMAAQEARADEGAVVLGTLFAGLGVSDLVFTIYTGIRVDENVEPDSGWMVAQTTVVGVQALLFNGLATGFAAFDKDDDGIDLALFPFASWLGTLSVFGAGA
jgi:hypothetical protein